MIDIFKPFLPLLILCGCVSNSPHVEIESSTNPESTRALAKFEPAGEEVLIFIGQDNESVGGNDRFNDGYIDHIGTPAGITHYIGLDSLDSNGTFPGLDVEADWQAGPMCLKYYLDSPDFADCIIHLSISMVGIEQNVANGDYDEAILHMARFMKTYSEHPYMIRIGYEFDGSWNHYEPKPFIAAWKRIVDILRQESIEEFATILASSTPGLDYETWEAFYPGPDYVDWIGYSYFWTPPDSLKLHVLDFARDKKHPLLMAECAPRGEFLGEGQGVEIWSKWFGPAFEHMEANRDIIKGFAYINCNWQSQLMWQNNPIVWGDTRVQIDSTIKARWEHKMDEPRYINYKDNAFELIRFKR